MDRETTKRLLKKYYEGRTSAEEEQLLRKYFGSGEVPPELVPDRELFAALAEEGSEKPPATLQGQLEDMIDMHYAATTERKTLSLRTWALRAIPLAASLILVLATYFFLLSRKPRDTYSDPQTAYLEAKKALLLVSRNFNKGTRSMAYLREISLPATEINKVQRTVGKLNDLPYIDLTPAETKNNRDQENTGGKHAEKNKNK